MVLAAAEEHAMVQAKADHDEIERLKGELLAAEERAAKAEGELAEARERWEFEHAMHCVIDCEGWRVAIATFGASHGTRTPLEFIEEFNAAERELDEARAEVERLADRKDGAYEERNRVVAVLARMALAMGFDAAVTRTAIEGWSDDWHGCVRINLPCGQVSWHFHDSQAHLFADLPHGEMNWDGHTTEQKYERLNEWRPNDIAAERQRVADWYADTHCYFTAGGQQSCRRRGDHPCSKCIEAERIAAGEFAEKEGRDG